MDGWWRCAWQRTRCLLIHRHTWRHFDRYLGDGYAVCPGCGLYWN